jgi:hypothetical protein
MSRKRSAYRPTLKKVPVTRELHDQIGMGLHTAYAVLKHAPDRNAVDQLSEGLGMVGIAIENDPRFVGERLQVDSAMRALDQIAAKGEVLSTTSFELVPILNAILTVDSLLPRLDGVKLYLALQKLRALVAHK